MRLYEMIYEQVLELVKAGNPGDKVYTEKEICNKYNVSRITARRVLGTLYKEGLIYRKTKLGTFIASKKSKRKIAVVLSQEEANNFKIIDSIIESNSQFGYQIDVFYSYQDINTENAIFIEISKKEYDGIIFFPSNNSENTEALSRIYIKKVPIVLLDFEVMGFDFPIVVSDNEHGYYEIVSGYIKKGYKKFAYINTAPYILDTVKERYRGYCKALLENEIPITLDGMFKKDVIDKAFYSKNIDEQRKAHTNSINFIIDAFLNTQNKPEVMCFVNDFSAASFISNAKLRGINIQTQVEIVGFDNLEISETMNFSTVQQNFYSMGKNALLMLDKLICGKNVEKRKVIKTKSIIRNKT